MTRRQIIENSRAVFNSRPNLTKILATDCGQFFEVENNGCALAASKSGEVFVISRQEAESKEDHFVESNKMIEQPKPKRGRKPKSNG